MNRDKRSFIHSFVNYLSSPDTRWDGIGPVVPQVDVTLTGMRADMILLPFYTFKMASTVIGWEFYANTIGIINLIVSIYFNSVYYSI